MRMRKQVVSVSRKEATIEDPRADHAFAAKYLKAALEQATLKTLLAVLHAVGMRLSMIPVEAHTAAHA